MFSGGDSSEGMNSLNKFSSYGFVNQAAVSNAVAAGQNIDWAQLAQQWIQMRDNTVSESIEAPPPPNISNFKNANLICKSSKFMEQGEADMDMDDEDQSDNKSLPKLDNKTHSDGVVQQHIIDQPWLINQATPLDKSGSQLIPRTSDSKPWKLWPSHVDLTQSPNQPTSCNRLPNPTAHIPSLLKINVPHPNEIRAMPDIPNQNDNSSTMMDAAKRKGLPAWIRDGLEKMEREKQKQMEMQQSKDNSWYSSEDETDPVKSPKHIMVKSLSTVNDACVDDHEESTYYEATTSTVENSNYQKMSINKIDENLEYDEEDTNTDGKTYEQKLADLMIVVRRTLTELLLEVTNEEISKVADETVKSFKSKASSVQVIRKSALSTITGKLGLAVYGDSSSDENSDDDEHDSNKPNFQSESEIDSEDEIKNVIRSKRRAFGKISDEIEECVASAASREEEKIKYFMRREEEERENKHKKYDRLQSSDPTCSGYSGHNIGKGYERDFGETSETKLQHLNGKRQKDRGARKERTTRFSDNKDNKYVALAATATFISNMNATTNAVNAGSSNVTQTSHSHSQRHNIQDVNGMLANTIQHAGITNVLNAADAALDKALKRKTSQSPKKHTRRRNHDRDRDRTPSKKRVRRDNSNDSRSLSSSSKTSSSSASSSDSDSSTSRSSHNSKYSHRSTTNHRTHKTSKKSEEQSPHDRRNKRSDDHKYSSSSSSYVKRDRETSSKRYHHRRLSSDSDDDYTRSRRKYDSHYSRNSSHSRTHTSSSSRRDRENSRSRSRSSYSSSSNRRH